ncbi:MAG TPA: toprim domain-containing protein [Polyangia bacterium]|nr:toprim domain-containing protein [Polyangia bacterium]
MDDELERFKRDVNLTELAASRGYRLVDRERSAEGKRRGSTQASISMRHPDTDDKIIIRRDRDGHWTYFSVRDDRDNGTVVDFLLRRGHPSLGAVRKELRLWLRVDRPKMPVALYRPSVRIHERDEAAAAAAYSRARAVRCRYLEDRGISREVAADRRFAGAYRMGEHGNVLFPHYDPATGLVVGFEVKNNGFTSFATGGRKTFWMSEGRPDDDRLVIVETAIDAFSYHQIFPHTGARYISTGGAVGPEALALIVAAIASMPAGADIVSATDADKEGEKMHKRLEVAGGRPLRRHASPLPKDWNDYLQSLERTRPHQRERRFER